MSELLTASQMRAIENAAIDSGEVTGLTLMERAGQAVVDTIFDEWPQMSALGDPLDKNEAELRAVILCGPGNNGGDGFVIARLLKERGWAVEVFLFGDADKLPQDAKVNYERWAKLGDVGPIDLYRRSGGWRCDLLVDALFGTGLKRGLPDLGDLFWNMGDMIECFSVEIGHKIGRPAIVAVDIPSGICADSGRDFPSEDHAQRFAAAAHLTVSFHRAKVGHFLADGAENVGKLCIVDIGLENSQKGLAWVESLKRDGEWLADEPAWKFAKRNLVNLCDGPHPSWMRKDGGTHKFSHGHALILSGGEGKTGAARLAARGALRIGAGLVTLGVPPAAKTEVASQITAVMMTLVADAVAFVAVLKDTRINAVCLGPGLGMETEQAQLVLTALTSSRAVVLDADALTLIAQEKALFSALHKDCVLTPHGGEFARLFPDIAERLAAPSLTGPAYSKVDATREAAKRAGCTVLYKGPDTVIAGPDGRCSIHAAQRDRAAPWLATAGSGDVLAGFITGLLARGMAPFQAAEAGAWLHVECARHFGAGLIAEDLPDALPQVFARMGV